MVAVDGPSGSGKTTLARTLHRHLPGSSVLHLDDLYPGWDGLEAAVPRLVDGVLRPLRHGEPTGFRAFDWDTQSEGTWRELTVGRVLVVDGVGSGARACRPFLDLLVWVDAPAPVRFARAMARDGDGYGPHWDRWAAQERRHFARERTREQATIRIDTTAPGLSDEEVTNGSRYSS